MPAVSPACCRQALHSVHLRRCPTSSIYQAKEDALSALRAVLFISEDEHLRIRKEVRDEVAAAPAHPSPPLSGPHTAPLGGGSSQPEAGASVRMSATPFESGVGTAGGSGAAAADSIAGRAASRRAAAAAADTTAQQQQQQQQQAADSRKRAKTDAGMSSASKRHASRQRSPVPIPPPAAPGEMDPLIGRKVERNWPGQVRALSGWGQLLWGSSGSASLALRLTAALLVLQQGGWFIGVISDYRPETGEHCIIYDFGTPKESYEW